MVMDLTLIKTMTGFSNSLKFICISAWLISSARAVAFTPIQTYALDQWDGELCMVEVSGNHSSLICNHTPLFHQALAGEALPENAQFLTKCPKAWIKNKTCTIIRVEKKIPLRTTERLQKLIYGYYTSIHNQLSHFLHNSLDDVIEDAISIGIPAKISHYLYSNNYGLVKALLLFEFLNLFLSPVGDMTGDVIEHYQNGQYLSEGESEWSIRGVVSNKVEDHVKIIGYVLSYHSTLIIQLFENAYMQPSLEMVDGPVAEATAHAGLYIIKKGAFVYDTVQMAEHYNKINQISDTLSDFVTEALFGEQ